MSPALEVVGAYNLRVGDYLAARSDEGRVMCEENLDRVDWNSVARSHCAGPTTKDVWKLRTMSIKKTTSTTLSTTSRGMSAIVLDRNAALYGTMTSSR